MKKRWLQLAGRGGRVHRTIKGFDGIRALAVIAVVLTHLGVFSYFVERQWLPEAFVPLIHGGTGVQVFFVLSGFLITSLLVEEFQRTGRVSVRNFIIRRTLRIFPLYVLFMVLATLLHVFGNNVTTWRSLFYVYAYSYNFVPVEAYTTFMGHTWSLAVEEHFYLVWPTLFLLLFGRARPVLVGLLVLFIASVPLLHVALVKSGLFAGYFVSRWSFIAGSSIAVGCLAALLLTGARTAARMRRVAGAPAGFLLGAFLYANTLYLSSDSWFVTHVLMSYLRTFGIALLITWLYINQSSSLARFLELRPLKYIGLISYGIYIFQGLFLDTGPERDAAQSWPPSPEVGLMLLIVIAPLSYHYFERPFLRLKSRYSLHASARAREGVQPVH